MQKAFTLIELLVVVLIIGILSAIALPQYRKAVDKARLAELLIQGRALLEAQQMYVTTNGDSMSKDIDALDIQVPVNKWDCNREGFCHTLVSIGGASFEVSTYHGYKLTLECLAGINDSYAQALCLGAGGEECHRHGSTIYYDIHRK